MLNKLCSHIKEGLLLIVIAVTTSPVLANLPKPPDSDIASGSSDWIDVGGSLTYKVLRYGLVALGVLILGAAAAGIINAWRTSQREQDLNHFYKHTAVALAAAAIGAGLVYAGYQIIPTS